MDKEKPSFDSFETEKRENNHKIGQKILEIVGKLTKKSEKEYNVTEYLLTERMEMPKKKKDREYFEQLYQDWDEMAKMPRELGEMIEGMVKDLNIWFGVHRSDAIDGSNFEDDEILQSIMQNGLKNHGDASSGAIYKNPPVDKTVCPCKDMLHATINIKGSYKRSTGAVLVAIPSGYLDKDNNVRPGMEEKVYTTDKNGLSMIKPEYLLGFVQNLGEGTTLKFKTREEILEHKKEAAE